MGVAPNLTRVDPRVILLEIAWPALTLEAIGFSVRL